MDTAAQRIPALKAESETLDAELFAAYQAKLVKKEERSQEDAALKRARDEQDRLLVCNRRKEDARRSMERLGEDEEHDRLKMAIMRKKIELECMIQNAAGQPVSADVGARAPLEAGRLVHVKSEPVEPQGPFVAAQPLLNGSPEAIVAEAPLERAFPSAALPLLNGNPQAIVAEAPRERAIPSAATAGSSAAGCVAGNGVQRAPTETVAIPTAAPLGKQPWDDMLGAMKRAEENRRAVSFASSVAESAPRNAVPLASSVMQKQPWYNMPGTMDMLETMKQAVEDRRAVSFASSVAGSAPRNAVPLAGSMVKSEPRDAVSHIPTMPSSMRHGLSQRKIEQPGRGGLHPSRLALISGISPPSSQSLQNGPSSGLHLQNSQLAPAASSNHHSANNANNWLDNMIDPDRKRKASTDAYGSPPIPKRFAFGGAIGETSHIKNLLANERALHSSHAAIVDAAATTLQTPDPQIIPRVPKTHFTVAGIRCDNVRRMLNCTQDTEVCLGRHGGPVLVLLASTQVHAPLGEREGGVYYTLLDPTTIRRQTFPVLVREAGEAAIYQYVGDYSMESQPRVLDDEEVDKLGVRVCQALVREGITKVGYNGNDVVRMGCVRGLLRDGVVRSDLEATKTTVDEFVRRMKTITLSKTFTGKPTKRLDIYVNKLVFRGFEKGYFQKYIARRTG